MIRSSLSRQIIIPLSVMLLLTVLLGFTMLQLVRPWENTVGKVNQHFAEVVILNQIRGDLRVLSQRLSASVSQDKDISKLKEDWHEIETKLRVFNRSSPGSPIILPAISFETEYNRAKAVETVNALLQRDYFRHKLSQTQAEIEDLVKYTRWVTLLITGSMVILGGVLMGLTANRLNKLIDQLSQSRDLNMRIQEEERRRIAQDLHDSVVQDIVDLKRNYQPDKADTLIDNVRRICHNLKPQVLHDLGLMSALEFLVDDLKKNSGIERVSLDVEVLNRLEGVPKELELSVFRVIQESFANIRRHAKASKVWVKFNLKQSNGTHLLGEIRDDGCGFNASERHIGMGLTGIKERIEQLGGLCNIKSKLGEGAEITFSIPLN